MVKTHYKLCVLGDGGVGKTAMTIQLCANHFVEEYDPTIEDSYRKQVVIDERPCLIEILDTAGQEEFTALRDQWIRDSEGFLIIYSITSRSSFEHVNSIMSSIRRAKDDENNEVMVVGNKCDLEHKREVSFVEGQRAAEMIGAMFRETSAKTRENVEDAFYDVIRSIRRQEDLSLKPKADPKAKSKRCTLF
jgi:GTPase KRas protein